MWDRLAAEILEESKVIFATGSEEAKAMRKVVLISLLSTSLKLLHPFMPFVTEEIWQHVPGEKDLLMVASWPS